MTEKRKKDWRSCRRKPLESQRTVNRGLKLTPAEATTLKANAATAGKTIVDFIVSRCC